MGGSPTINVMVYTHSGGSPKLMYKTFRLVFNWIFKFITQDIKKLIIEFVSAIIVTRRKLN